MQKPYEQLQKQSKQWQKAYEKLQKTCFYNDKNHMNKLQKPS